MQKIAEWRAINVSYIGAERSQQEKQQQPNKQRKTKKDRDKGRKTRRENDNGTGDEIVESALRYGRRKVRWRNENKEISEEIRGKD